MLKIVMMIWTSVCFLLFSNIVEADNYPIVNSEFHDRLFKSGKIEFDEGDIMRVCKLYSSATDSVSFARVQYLDALSRFYALVPEYKKADEMVDSALCVLTAQKYPQDYAKLALLKGMISRRYLLKYDQSYFWLNEALKMFQQQNDMLYLAKTYSQLGVLWVELLDFESALKCNSKAEKLYANTNYKQNMSFMRCNSYVVYSQKGEYKRSTALMRKELKLIENSNDTACLFLLNHNIGQNYYQENELSEALDYYMRAQSLILLCSKPNLDYKALSYKSLGKLYYRMGDFPQALETLSKGLEFAQKAGIKDSECGIYYCLFEVYDALGKYSEACEAIKQYEKMSGAINLRSEAQEVQRMKYQLELNAQQQQARMTQQENALKQKILWISLLSIGLVLIVIVLLLLIIVHRRRIQKIENEQLAQQLEKEEMKNALQQIEHDRNIEEKQREIATASLLIAEKSALLEQLSETFKPYKESGELSLKMWNELNRFVQNNTRKDEEWKNFKIHFEKVHPEFFVKLKECCSDLTENELRLCSYIRIGVRVKEIAEMLSITPASVATSRYRIKKKLKLVDEQLDDYLRSI